MIQDPNLCEVKNGLTAFQDFNIMTLQESLQLVSFIILLLPFLTDALS